MKLAKAASCGLALECTFSDVVAFVAVRAVSSEGEGETLEPAALTGATALTLYLNATKRFPVPLDSWVIQTPPYPIRAEALC